MTWVLPDKAHTNDMHGQKFASLCIKMRLLYQKKNSFVSESTVGKNQFL